MVIVIVVVVVPGGRSRRRHRAAGRKKYPKRCRGEGGWKKSKIVFDGNQPGEAAGTPISRTVLAGTLSGPGRRTGYDWRGTSMRNIRYMRNIMVAYMLETCV